MPVVTTVVMDMSMGTMGEAIAGGEERTDDVVVEAASPPAATSIVAA